MHEWITITSFCETMSCLPNEGGLLDQQRNHIRYMEAILRARTQWFEDKSPGTKQSPDTKRKLDEAQARANREEPQLI